MNSVKYHFADFTLDNYRRLIQIAKQNYAFRFYDNFTRDERFMLWRHDVDFSMTYAIRTAEIEHDEGVVATYFLNPHSEFYNLLDPQNKQRVHRLIELGHQIALHFDSHYYNVKQAEDLEESLRFERTFLERLFGQEITSFAFHNTTPFILSCDDWKYAGMINTYAKYFQKEVGYCSDSNGHWRHKRLEDVLSSAEDYNMQVLTHPAWWQENIGSPEQRLWHCIDSSKEETKTIYLDLVHSFGRELITD